MKTFSDLLSEYIERVGMSDAELARRLGVSRQTIFRWRDGQIQRPRYRQDVLDLAHKLRLSIEERDQLLVTAGFAPEDASAALAGQKPVQTESRSGRNLRLILRGYWKWALVLLAVLAVGLFAFPERRPAPAAEGEILILVSEFSQVGGELGFNVAGRLEEGIRAAIEQLALESIRVESYPESIDSQELAQSLLEELDAALIVWGEYDSGRVVVQILSRDLSGEVFPRQKYWILDRTETLPATINLDLPQEVNWLALFAIGRSLQVQGAYGLAQQAYEIGLRYVEDDSAREAQLYFYLGFAEASKPQGDLDRVIAYYSEVLSRKADYPSALNNRAVAYMHRNTYGDLERARIDLLNGIEVDPDNARLYLNLGLVRIWQDKDNLAQGIEDFKQAEGLDPDSPSIQNALCWNLSLDGDPEGALAHCERALTLDPSGNNYDSLGLTLALLGRYDDALQAFQTSLDLMEDDDPARYQVLSPSRLSWIEALSVGDDPFDPATLEALLHE
jgi:tetratricopeptide (TPR) repeat protein/DNA-binding XRE family transcriptional regulator